MCSCIVSVGTLSACERFATEFQDQEVLRTSGLEGLTRIVRERKVALAVVEAGSHFSAWGKALDALGKAAVPVIVLLENGDDGLYRDLLGLGVLNFIGSWNESAETRQALKVTVAKLCGQHGGGIKVYAPNGDREQTWQIRRSSDKAKIVDGVMDIASGLRAHTRVQQAVGTIVDELLTNALYDAPTDPQGSSRFASFSRRRSVELDEHERVELACSSSESGFGIRVTDPFGSLRPYHVRTGLMRGLTPHGAEVKRGSGGAGLGFAMLFKLSHHLVFEIVPGVRTEVLAVVDLTRSGRGLRSPKSLNVFST